MSSSASFTTLGSGNNPIALPVQLFRLAGDQELLGEDGVDYIRIMGACDGQGTFVDKVGNLRNHNIGKSKYLHSEEM